MPDFTWQLEAPIYYVEQHEVSAKVKQFDNSVKAYCEGDESWNSRKGSSLHISHLVDIHADEGLKPCYEYRMNGQTVALMVLHIKPGDCIEIKDLVTHPGTANAGGIMVEYALNRVAHYDAQGADLEEDFLELESLNADSTAAYEALGFVDAGKKMYLQAEKSDLWKKVGGNWKLAKFEHAVGYSGLKPV